MQTAVMKLKQQLKDVLGDIFIDFALKQEFEQAKEMERKAMIDFGNDLIAQNDTNYIGVPNLAEQYYNETYGSKGSDEHIVDTNEMISSQTEMPESKSFTIYDFNEIYALGRKDYIKYGFPQISDEEIEKCVIDILKKENREGIYFREDMERIIEGAKWYREQLKSRQ